MAPFVAALLHAGASLLDVGSGQGCALEWFSNAGFDVAGMDINRENIEACQRLGFPMFDCDMNNMPDDWSGYADCVWARHVLEHSIAPFFTLHEFARVLKSGGILYMEAPMPDTPCNHAANPNHYSVLGKDAWLCLITRAGFELHEVREIGLMTMAGPDRYLSVIARRV
jgi:SAM-dependent methyltransferase